MYDRVLAGPDFTGWLASDPASGGFDVPGLLRPVQVGAWGSTTAAGPDGWLYGEVDDVGAYQGVLTDVDVRRLVIE